MIFYLILQKKLRPYSMELSRYTTFPSFLSRHLSGKTQKISINAGFTCPNRDGTTGYGGCTYCNNQTFSPDYCHTGKSVSLQIEEGIQFFSQKYPEMKYLAYFQAYTSTYDTFKNLVKLYEEALKVPGVVGLIIGTRPDCMPEEILKYLKELSRHFFVLVEYGIESTNENTLRRINRGHTWQQSQDTILRTADKKIFQGVHLILGLPGENKEDIITHAKKTGMLPIQAIKLHQLQIIRQTAMEKEFHRQPENFYLYPIDEYIDLAIDFIEYIPPTIAIERFTSQSPEELLFAPKWGLKNHEFIHKLHHRMEERNTFQGRLFS